MKTQPPASAPALAAHTPFALSDDGDVIFNARGNTVAELRIDHDAPDRLKEFRENARLFCAAPDLLAALEQSLTQMGEYMKVCENENALVLAGVITEARAAIARAKGQP